MNRPISPHLSIYRPQITWILSAGHRITGAALASLLYGFGAGYGAGVIGSPATMPGALNSPLFRGMLIAPFVFHSLNGLRHISWDMTLGMSQKTVKFTGWTTVFATVAGTVKLMQRKSHE
jgi:succinate dehydrogenase (ubiquinone) cytochrome b560 subunit